jgi:hypothetical protein
MRIDSSVGNQSVAVIMDDPENRSTGSRINLSNNAEFFGNGDKSYVLLVSQNNAAESGGATDAVYLSNNAEGQLLLYAGHGSIEVENNADVNEATAYRIDLGNNAVVTYAEGLANLIFTLGPAGGYTISEWRGARLTR